MKQLTSKLGFLALATTLVFASCGKKEMIITSTANDSLNTNNSNLDAVYDRTVNYSVAVTAQKESDFRSPMGVDAATVVVSVDGSNVSVTTGADGIATFSGIKAGLVSVSVTKADWTSASYIVDLTNSNVNGTGGDIDNHSERSAATLVTLLKTANLGTSTLTGDLEIERNQNGNTQSETMASGKASLTARVNFNNYDGNGSSQSGVGFSHTGYGQVLDFYYEGLMGTANFPISGDTYSVTMPASAYGLDIIVNSNPFKENNVDFGGVTTNETFNIGGSASPVTIWNGTSYTGQTYIVDLFYQ